MVYSHYTHPKNKKYIFMWPTSNISPLFSNQDKRDVSYEGKNKVLNVTAPLSAIQHHALLSQHGNIWYPACSLGRSREPRQGYKETLDWWRNVLYTET